MARIGRSRPASNYRRMTKNNAFFTGVGGSGNLNLNLSFSGSGINFFFNPNGFPFSRLPIKVEILLNGTWIDISSYVYQRSTITIARGRGDETQQIQPASMTLTLRNTDFRFAPLNTTSPYYPYLTRNVQIRLSIVGVQSTAGATYTGYRFWGEVASWPTSWDPTERDQYVAITAGGILRRYVQAKLLGSALRRFYMLKTDATAPIAYWPMEEQSGASQFNNLIIPADPLTWTGGPPTLAGDSNFSGSDPIPQISLANISGNTGSYSSSGSVTYTTPGTYILTGPGGVTTVTAQRWGGGAGGGGGADEYGGGSGGGGGQYATDSGIAITPGNNYTVVVGAGGSAGQSVGSTVHTSGRATAIPGTDGGDSTFTGDSGSPFTAVGGGSGLNASNPGAGGATTAVKIFRASGTWISPITGTIILEAWAGGGGPGSSTGQGGGGGGEYAKEAALAVTAGHSYPFTVGLGGAAANAGGNTVFAGDSVTVTAHGGSTASGNTGGVGGTGSGNTTHFNGGNGGNGTGGSDNTSGSGGASGGTAGAGTNGTGPSGGLPGILAAAVAGGGPGAGQTLDNNGIYKYPPQGPGGGGCCHDGRGADGAIRITYVLSAPATAFSGGLGGTGFLDDGSDEDDGGGGGGGSGGTAANGNNGGNGTKTAGGVGATAVTGGGSGGSDITDHDANPGGVPGGGGGGTQADINLNAGAGASGKVIISWTPTGTPQNVVIRFLLDIPSTGSVDGAVLVRGNLASGGLTYYEVYYQAAGSGTLGIRGYLVGVKKFDSALAGPASVNGLQLMVSMELATSGANLNWKIDSIKPGAGSSYASNSGTYTTATIGSVSSVNINPAGATGINDVAIGHVVLQYALEALTVVSTSINGHAGELAGNRFTRLAAEQGFGGILRGNASDTPAMGPQLDKKLTDLLQEIEDCDRGQLIEARDMFGMYYRTRVNMQNQSPQVTYDYSLSQLAADLTPVYDDQLTRNDISVTRPGGSTASQQLNTGALSTQLPPNGVGDYTYTAQINVNTDSQLPNLVQWMLTVGTADVYRYPNVNMDLRRTAALVIGVFDLTPVNDIGDYIQIINTPTQIPENPVKQLDYGYTEYINTFDWRIVFNTVPEAPYTGAGLPTW